MYVMEVVVSIRDLSPCPQTRRRDSDSEMRDKSELTANDVESAKDVKSDSI